MVAKLRACRDAAAAAVAVSILDGRDVAAFPSAPGTQIVAEAVPPLAGP
jgi:hypothetical protein